MCWVEEIDATFHIPGNIKNNYTCRKSWHDIFKWKKKQIGHVLRWQKTKLRASLCFGCGFRLLFFFVFSVFCGECFSNSYTRKFDHIRNIAVVQRFNNVENFESLKNCACLDQLVGFYRNVLLGSVLPLSIQTRNSSEKCIFLLEIPTMR